MKLQMVLRKSYYPEPRRSVVEITPGDATRTSVSGAVNSFKQEQGYRPTHLCVEISREEAVTILNSPELAAVAADLPPWKTIGELLRHYLVVDEIQLTGASLEEPSAE